MNTTPLHSTRIPGFKVVSSHRINDVFHDSQSAFFVLLGRRQATQVPDERVLFVDYVDDLLEACQKRIDEFWEKHHVMITHVAVKLGGHLRPNHRNLNSAYERALAVQELRRKLNPEFRRL